MRIDPQKMLSESSEAKKGKSEKGNTVIRSKGGQIAIPVFFRKKKNATKGKDLPLKLGCQGQMLVIEPAPDLLDEVGTR